MHRFALVALVSLALAACASPPPNNDAGLDAVADSGTDAALLPADVAADAPAQPAEFVFDPAADLTVAAQFYNVPYPSDLRLSAAGTPDLRGFTYPANATIVSGLLDLAQHRPGFPTVAVAYFRFTRPLAPQDATHVIPATPASPVLLVDIDARASERGRLLPTVAAALPTDLYTPPSVLAVAARPGFVMRANRTYAFVVMRALGSADGLPLTSPPAFEMLKTGNAPAGALGAAALAAYQPLWDTLDTLHVDRNLVAAATVFTTGDVVAETAQLGNRILQQSQYSSVAIQNLALAADDDRIERPRFCHLTGTISPPQFQQGVPPFATMGTFQFGADGLPIPTTYPSLPGYATVPVSITIPRTLMPTNGFPLAVYFHGSGGVSSAVVDRGVWRPQSATVSCAHPDVWNGVPGCNTLGEGPGFVLAARGIAAAGSALPVNPERLPGASETAYLNIDNLAAFRDTFRQGVIEQRFFIRALSQLQIPAALVAQCGATLPTGATFARFDMHRLIAQGQSMGGMYTNMVSATEPLVAASIPTGAGGFWGYFILQTQLLPGAAGVLGLLLRTQAHLTFMHPALALLETAWEAAEPIVYMPRVARDPLPGHPTRPIYEPVGQGDSYFPTTVYDAVALAYGHQQAGTNVWPTMQTALALGGLDGIVPYPVSNNRMGTGSAAYTGVVIQYAGDGVYDPHAIYSQLDAVKYQYSCFASSFVNTGIASVPDPTGMAADAPCPAH